MPRVDNKTFLQAYLEEHCLKTPLSTASHQYTAQRKPGSVIDPRYLLNGRPFRSQDRSARVRNDNKKALVLCDWEIQTEGNAYWKKHQKLFEKLRKQGFKLYDSEGEPLDIRALRNGDEKPPVFHSIEHTEKILKTRGQQPSDYCLLSHWRMQQLSEANRIDDNRSRFRDSKPPRDLYKLSPSSKQLKKFNVEAVIQASNAEEVIELVIPAAAFNQLPHEIWAQFKKLRTVTIDGDFPDPDQVSALISQIPCVETKIVSTSRFRDVDLAELQAFLLKPSLSAIAACVCAVDLKIAASVFNQIDWSVWLKLAQVTTINVDNHNAFGEIILIDSSKLNKLAAQSSNFTINLALSEEHLKQYFQKLSVATKNRISSLTFTGPPPNCVIDYLNCVPVLDLSQFSSLKSLSLEGITGVTQIILPPQLCVLTLFKCNKLTSLRTSQAGLMSLSLFIGQGCSQLTEFDCPTVEAEKLEGKVQVAHENIQIFLEDNRAKRRAEQEDKQSLAGVVNSTLPAPSHYEGSRSLGLYQKREKPPTLQAFTRIEEIIKDPLSPEKIIYKKVAERRYYRDIYTHFMQGADGITSLVRLQFDQSTPAAVFSEEPPTNRAKARLSCVKGKPILITTLGPYDTLTKPNNFADYGTIIEGGYGCYVLFPNQTGSIEVAYTFLQNDPLKLGRPHKIEKYPLPPAFQQGFDLLLANKAALFQKKEIDQSCYNLLNQLAELKALGKQDRTPELLKQIDVAIERLDGAIRAYFTDAFKDESPVATGLDFLKHLPEVQMQFRMLVQQCGVCEHRANLAFALYQYVAGFLPDVDLPVYINSNDCHDCIWQYRKIAEGTYRWEQVELGGGEAKIKNVFDPNSEPSTSDQFAVSTALTFGQPEEDDAEENDAKEKAAEENDAEENDAEEKGAEEKDEKEGVEEEESFAAYFEPASEATIRACPDRDSLLQWVAKQSGSLVWTSSFEQSRDLYRALYPYLTEDNDPQAHVFYIESPQDLQNFVQSLVIQDGQYQFKQLFMDGGHLVINWAGFSATEIASYKDDLFLPQPKFKGHFLPTNLNITHLAHADRVHCQSFLSLFSLEKQLEWPQHAPYDLSQPVEKAEEKIDAVLEEKDAYGTEWECLLQGRIGIQGNQFSFVASDLAKAIEAGKSGFRVCDPPQQNEEFNRFWFRLEAEGRFLHNGAYIKIPDGFSLQCAPAPDEPLTHLIETLCPMTGEEAWKEIKEEVPPQGNLAFETAAEKLRLFFSYLEQIPHGKRGTPNKPRMSEKRYHNAMKVLLKGKSKRNNPIKDLFLRDYDKNSENFAFANVIAKILFVDYLDEETHKEPIRINKLKALNQRFKGMSRELWWWQRLNCYSASKLRELFYIRSDADIARVLVYGRPTREGEQQLPYAFINHKEEATLSLALSEAQEEKSEKQSFAKSMLRMEEALEEHGMVILKGPPGSGKTFAAIDYAKRMKAPLHFGRDAMAACLADAVKGLSPVLLLDEINLNLLGSLEGVRALIKKGVKVIGTANEESDGDNRELDPLVQDQVTIYVKTWSREECIERLLMPLASKLNWPDPTQKVAICEALVTILELAKQHTPEKRLSTRDLHQMLFRLQYRWQIAQKTRPEDASWQSILMTVVSDEWRSVIKDPKGFKDDLFKHFKGCYSKETEQALSVYFDGYKNAICKGRKAIEAYLEQYSKVTFQDPNGPLLMVLSSLKSEQYYVLPHREQDIALLVEDILIHQKKQALAPWFDPAITGKSGFLITGESGVGKSEVSRIILSTLGIPSDKFTIGEPHATQTALSTAFHTQEAIIGDELDLAAKALEAQLNQFLTGKDATGKPIKREEGAPTPYFCGTRNGVKYEGRHPLSVALKNRLHLIKSLDYSAFELRSIAEMAGFPPKSAKRFVDDYLAACRRYPLFVNTRTFFKVLKTLAAAPVKKPLVEHVDWKTAGASMVDPEAKGEKWDAEEAKNESLSALVPKAYRPRAVNLRRTTKQLVAMNVVIGAMLAGFGRITVGILAGFFLANLGRHYYRNRADQSAQPEVQQEHVEWVNDEAKPSSHVYGTDDLFEQNKYRPFEVPDDHKEEDGKVDRYRVDNTLCGKLANPNVTTVVLGEEPPQGLKRHLDATAGALGKEITLAVMPKNIPPKERGLQEILRRATTLQRGAMLIESDDPHYVSCALEKQLRDCESFDVSSEARWDTHIEEIAFIDTNALASLDFSYRLQPIVEALSARKTVILQGHLPLQLAKELSSLFDDQPYLTLNAEMEPIFGRLFIVTHPLPENPYVFAPGRTARVRVESKELFAAAYKASFFREYAAEYGLSQARGFFTKLV